MKKVAVLTLLMMHLSLVGTLQAQVPEPVGDEFQVNTYTTGRQLEPAAATDARGNFVVVWGSFGSDGSDQWERSIQAQVYDSNGIPVGEQFQVNTYTTGGQSFPGVAMAGDGSFVVAWRSAGIFARRFDATGAPLGGEFQVNSYTTHYGSTPSVASDDEGNFVVVWSSYHSPGTDWNFSIEAQRFNATGTPQGEQFQVNSYTRGRQYAPAVAADFQGDFVVVWESDQSSGPDLGYSIQGQRYDDSGAPLSSEFQVNSYTTGGQMYPAIAADAQGNFAVVWGSDGSSGTDTSYTSTQAQVYDSSGAPLGSQFQVNSYTMSYQWRPAVAANPLGGFVMVWGSIGSHGTDSSGRSIQGQVYDSNGIPVGGEFQVNSYTTGDQERPSVAMDARGDFVVTWQSDGSHDTDTKETSIQAQRYSFGVIFTDGFESGDTSAWSGTVQ